MLHAVGSDGQTFTPSHICASPGTEVTLHAGPEIECPVFSQDPTLNLHRVAEFHAATGVAVPMNGDA